MPLIDLQTNLKSLKYGSDRLGGGDSGLPYIKKDINTANTGLKFDDGLVRGGIVNAAIASAIDTARIAKFLYADQPRGVLFIAKQVGLQLANPRLEIPKNPANIASGLPDNVLSVGTNGLLQPTRIYNLGVNTLAQVPINFLGLHINRHGILPIQTNASKYEAVVTANNDLGGSSKFNRLVGLTDKFKLGDRTPNLTINRRIANTLNTIFQTISLVTGTPPIKPLKVNPQDLIIDDYAAGPSSIYGIGRTTINRYSNTEDSFRISLLTTRSGEAVRLSTTELNQNLNRDTVTLGPSTYPNVPSPKVPNSIYGNIKTYADIVKKNKRTLEGYTPSQQILQDIGAALGGFGFNTTSNTNPTTFRQIQSNPDEKPIKISGSVAFSSTPIPGGKIKYTNTYGDVVTINKPNWSAAARPTRIGSGRTDSINLTPLFESNTGDDSEVIEIDRNKYTINDLVKFRIQSLNTDFPGDDNNSPGKVVYMIFRAYITSFDDSVNANWDPIKYVGRGEEFYVYNGYTRKINIGFKVAALSAKEMQPMYQKLNYLMSNLMPDYKGVFMRGPMVRMTVGNWIDSQVGIINSLTYTVSNDSPWEIALNEPTAGGAREMVLPHIVDVSLSFTPIGVQTQGKDQLAKKSNQQSNIAQNWNGATEASNYIFPTSSIPSGKPESNPGKLY